MYFYAVFLLDSPLTFRTVIGGEQPDFGVGIGMSGQVARFSAGGKGFVGRVGRMRLFAVNNKEKYKNKDKP